MKSDNFSLDTPNVVSFRLFGVDLSHSITEFNYYLGFIDEHLVKSRECLASVCDSIEHFASYYVRIWKEMSIDKFRYDPSQSKASYFKDPILKYIQRFLAFNFF